MIFGEVITTKKSENYKTITVYKRYGNVYKQKFCKLTSKFLNRNIEFSVLYSGYLVKSNEHNTQGFGFDIGSHIWVWTPNRLVITYDHDNTVSW